jgi:hypothetical protein
MVDMLSKEDAIETLSEGKETYGKGKEEAIKIIKSWKCKHIYLDFLSETSVVFINADNQNENFQLNIMGTVH